MSGITAAVFVTLTGDGLPVKLTISCDDQRALTSVTALVSPNPDDPNVTTVVAIQSSDTTASAPIDGEPDGTLAFLTLTQKTSTEVGTVTVTQADVIMAKVTVGQPSWTYTDKDGKTTDIFNDPIDPIPDASKTALVAKFISDMCYDPNLRSDFYNVCTSTPDFSFDDDVTAWFKSKGYDLTWSDFANTNYTELLNETVLPWTAIYNLNPVPDVDKTGSFGTIKTLAVQGSKATGPDSALLILDDQTIVNPVFKRGEDKALTACWNADGNNAIGGYVQFNTIASDSPSDGSLQLDVMLWLPGPDAPTTSNPPTGDAFVKNYTGVSFVENIDSFRGQFDTSFIIGSQSMSGPKFEVVNTTGAGTVAATASISLIVPNGKGSIKLAENAKATLDSVRWYTDATAPDDDPLWKTLSTQFLRYRCGQLNFSYDADVKFDDASGRPISVKLVPSFGGSIWQNPLALVNNQDHALSGTRTVPPPPDPLHPDDRGAVAMGSVATTLLFIVVIAGIVRAAFIFRKWLKTRSARKAKTVADEAVENAKAKRDDPANARDYAANQVEVENREEEAQRAQETLDTLQGKEPTTDLNDMQLSEASARRINVEITQSVEELDRTQTSVSRSGDGKCPDPQAPDTWTPATKPSEEDPSQREQLFDDSGRAMLLHPSSEKTCVVVSDDKKEVLVRTADGHVVKQVESLKAPFEAKSDGAPIFSLPFDPETFVAPFKVGESIDYEARRANREPYHEEEPLLPK